MYFVFGTRYLGGVKSYNEQEIQTKFFHFCFLPLFPVEGDSLLVTESGFGTRKGIFMKLNNTSVLAGYGRMWITGLAVLSFFGCKATGSTGMLLLTLALAVFAGYLWLFYGKNKPEEIEERELIGSMTGIYATADWLSESISDSIYSRMREAYAAEGRSWQEDLRNGIVPNPRVIYVMAMLNNAAHPCEENFELRMMAAKVYAAKLESSN